MYRQPCQMEKSGWRKLRDRRLLPDLIDQTYYIAQASLEFKIFLPEPPGARITDVHCLVKKSYLRGW